ncbi:MAG: hypothetical protein ACR2IS_10530 [Nitrososphaeraceae archaeon]
MSATFQEDGEIWTAERLTDELFLCLLKAREDGGSRKYEQQAKHLIYRIPIYRPIPFFIVKIKDLSPKLKEELVSLEGKSLGNVIIEAIGRLVEQVDERYFPLSVRRLLKWKLE